MRNKQDGYAVPSVVLIGSHYHHRVIPDEGGNEVSLIANGRIYLYLSTGQTDGDGRRIFRFYNSKEWQPIWKGEESAKTTDLEKETLEHLADAWRCFLRLPVMHPNDHEEFVDALHRIQCLIAWRVAVRLEPDVWGPSKSAAAELKEN